MHPPGLQPEQRLVVAGLLADQQVERAVGGLELVAAVSSSLTRSATRAAPSASRSSAGLVRAGLHGAPARQLGDQQPAVGAHLRRVDVLERARVAVHARHVHAALVRERVGAHVGLVGIRRHVAQLVDQVRGLGQVLQPLRRHAVVAQLELQVGQDRDQVGVAAALAVAVHRALHHAGAALDGHERCWPPRTPASSWVWMPTWTRSPSSATTASTASANAVGQRGAVGVAQGHVLGAGLDGGAQAAQRVVGVVGPGVEEVLGVVDHALALAAQERDRVRDHRAGSPRDPRA